MVISRIGYTKLYQKKQNYTKTNPNFLLITVKKCLLTWWIGIQWKGLYRRKKEYN